MYADKITKAMKQAMDETDRRRVIQEAYNKEHGIVPATVVRAIMNINPAAGTTDYLNVPKTPKGAKGGGAEVDASERIIALRAEMFAAAEALDFERAARLRDELKRLDSPGSVNPSDAPEIAFDPYGAPKKGKSRAVRGGNAASMSKPKSTGRARKS
jgi:excinuclease ABC subunit B